MNYIRDGRAPIPKSEQISKIMSKIKGKNTKPEMKFRKALRDLGLRGYRLHWKKVVGSPDIAYPGKKIAIFIHGCFWHRCPKCNPQLPKTHIDFWENKFNRNIMRDTEKINKLMSDDWKVFVFWECEINSNPIKYAKRIKKYVESKK